MNKYSVMKAIALTVGIALVVTATTGCARRRQTGITTTDDSTTRTQRTDDTGYREGLPDVDLETLLFDRDSGLQPVYFDFDRFDLRPDARETLRQNAELINQAPGVMILIEGHCDERGTQEYNLALGEKRALSVRQYLMNMGVSGDRLITISYGKERPADPRSNEEAWARNRRAEFSRGRR